MTTEEYRKTYAAYGVSYADYCIKAGLDMSPQGFRDYVEEHMEQTEPVISGKNDG
jgi:hypothetical protein